MEPYRSKYPDAGLKLPLTERLVERLVTLPTGTGVSPRQISEICGLIKWVVSHGPEVHDRRSRLPI
jgi:dTDP-4-amino-4,6-dideoxygalactose transaminase